MLTIPTRIYFAKNSIGIMLKINELSKVFFAIQFILSINIISQMIHC